MSKNEELKKQLEEEINNLMIERRKRLNEAIKAKHFTLVQLEELIGVAKSSIQRYLTGETTKIPIDFFEKIAAVTDTPVEYLTCFEKEKTAPIETNQDDLAEVIKVAFAPSSKYGQGRGQGRQYIGCYATRNEARAALEEFIKNGRPELYNATLAENASINR